MTNPEKIRQMSAEQIVDILLSAMRDDLSYQYICSITCDDCLFRTLCINGNKDVCEMGDSEWKEWLESEVKECARN